MKAPMIACEAAPQPAAAEAFFLDAKDGARIRIVRYPLSSERAHRGTVVVHPGWSEFAEKYVEVASDLNDRGFGVVVFDPRGQGYSQRLQGEDRRGHIDDFAKFVGDLDVVIDHVRRAERGPYAILAHSMGGLVTLEWLAEGNGADLSGVALCAPLTNLFRSLPKAAFVKSVLATGRILGRGTAPLPGVEEHSWQFDGNVLTQDPVRHERFRQLQLSAPEAVAGLPKFDWLSAALAGMGRIQAKAALADVALPEAGGRLLLVSAERDETVDPIHHKELAEQYPDLIDYTLVPGARHELLMEADVYRDQFFGAFDQYMEERLPAASSSAPSSVPRT